MFELAQETTINKGIRETSIQESLLNHLIKSRAYGDSQFIEIQKGCIDNFEILGLGDGSFITPKPFTHPILIEHDNIRYLVIDTRTCSKYNKMEGHVTITNPTLFRREVIRAALTSIWINDGVRDILGAGAFQIQIFTNWISDILARRFGLEPEEHLRVGVIAAFFYVCQFSSAERVDLRRFLAIISKATRSNISFVLSVLDGLEYIPNIEAFLDTIHEQTPSGRLEGVGVDVFISMLAGSWFGPNHSILVGTALEYPPLWNTLLYLSLTDMSNRATGIGKTALRLERDPSCREYLASINSLLITYTSIDVMKARG